MTVGRNAPTNIIHNNLRGIVQGRWGSRTSTSRASMGERATQQGSEREFMRDRRLRDAECPNTIVGWGRELQHRYRLMMMCIERYYIFEERYSSRSVRM